MEDDSAHSMRRTTPQTAKRIKERINWMYACACVRNFDERKSQCISCRLVCAVQRARMCQPTYSKFWYTYMRISRARTTPHRHPAHNEKRQWDENEVNKEKKQRIKNKHIFRLGEWIETPCASTSTPLFRNNDHTLAISPSFPCTVASLAAHHHMIRVRIRSAGEWLIGWKIKYEQKKKKKKL